MTDTPQTAAPVATESRLGSLDALRGFAVLGILLLNILAFGLPGVYENPTSYGDFTGANYTSWLTTSIFFEGTMRGLFTLLFGAGVLLFTGKLEQAGIPDAADLHVRRMLWLIAFGLVNSHLLLWEGDILFEYGLVGLVLYAFRKARPHTMIALAIVLLASQPIRGKIESNGLAELRTEAQQIAQRQHAGESLSIKDKDTLKEWEEAESNLKPPPTKTNEQVEKMRGGWADIVDEVTDSARFMRTTFLYKWGFPESLGTMLLGAALFSWGVLQGRWSMGRYALLALVGYGIGLTVNLLEVRAIVNSGFDSITIHRTFFETYELGRVPMTLGHLGLVLLVWKSGWLSAPLRVLAAAGRMAFTNYLMQSLICAIVFTGLGFGLYGQLQRYQLYYVVAAIWAVQLIWSPLWLKYYRYGPLEWLWRSLTYRKMQPLRLAKDAPKSPI
jgi:uncharacterized protein